MKKLVATMAVVIWMTFITGCADNSIQCTEEQKNAEICTMEYMPVCGNDNITYGNTCSACVTEGVDSYVEGACEEAEETNQEE